MDILLISPMEVSLSDKTLFRETNIKSDLENLKQNPINNIYVKRSRENLGIEMLAAHLRSGGFDVAIINAHTSTEKLTDTIARIMKINPKIIGIGLMYDLHAFNACLFAQLLRKEGYEGHITFGGTFVTFTYEYFIHAIPEIDSIVRGEGEVPLMDLATAILNGDDWRDIRGIVYKKGNAVATTPPAIGINDFDKLPPPARDVLEDLRAKKVPLRVASFMASRGCNGRCVYCTSPASQELSTFYNWRPRSVEKVLDEIEYLVNEFNVDFLYFCDYHFFGYGRLAKTWLLDFAQGIQDRNIKIKFHATARADRKVSPEILEPLRDAGLQYILLGIESGAQTALDRWLKKTSVQQNIDSIKVIRDLGFELDPGMIMVDPHTTLEEFEENIAFIEKTGIHECFFPMYLFNQIIVFPGTHLETQYIIEGIVQKPDPKTVPYDVYQISGLLKFCRRVASRPYVVQDPVVREMWEVLTLYTNNATWLVEDCFPTLLNQWRQKMKGTKLEGNAKKEEAQRHLEFVRLLRGWRGAIGTLALDYMKHSVEWGKEKRKNPELTARDLDDRLKKVFAEYNSEWFEQGIHRYLSDCIERLDLNFEMKNITDNEDFWAHKNSNQTNFFENLYMH